MTTVSSEDENFVTKFLKNMQDKLHSIFNDLQNDFQTIPDGYGKKILKQGQLGLIFLYIIVTLLIIIYAIFYRIDKAKLNRIEMPYNIQTIAYQAIGFTHPKYKGKYQYFPILIFVCVILALITIIFSLTMIKLDSIRVKGFYFIMAVLLVIPVIVYLILYRNISKYLKPRNQAKNEINNNFFKYMISDSKAILKLSIIPDGGRFSISGMQEALSIIGSNNKKSDNQTKIKELHKVIITFTLYQYYLQKSIEDTLLEQALREIFGGNILKKKDYCNYLPNNLQVLIPYEINKIIQYDRNLSSIFSNNIVNQATQSARITIGNINKHLNKIIIDEDIFKKFIMMNAVIWIIFMTFISIILASAMSFQPKTI